MMGAPTRTPERCKSCGADRATPHYDQCPWSGLVTEDECWKPPAKRMYPDSNYPPYPLRRGERLIDIQTVGDEIVRQRKYSIQEIDDMRDAVSREHGCYDPVAIENRLRTYMMASVDPSQLVAEMDLRAEQKRLP